MDQDSSWWAKANRAKEHIDSLRRQVEEYRASAPYSLTPEPTERPDRLAYRLRFSKPAPVTISTTVGDVLHNLRAALESRQTQVRTDRKSTRLNSSHVKISYAVFCLKKKKKKRADRLLEKNTKQLQHKPQHTLIR